MYIGIQFPVLEEELAGSICRIAFLENPEDGSNKTHRNAGTYRQICAASHLNDLGLLQHRCENIISRIHFKFLISIAGMPRIRGILFTFITLACETLDIIKYNNYIY